MEFPRILVVTSNNFNLVTGSGITLTNLFYGWPSDRIANLHEDPQPEDRTVCTNFYRLTNADVPWIWPLSLLQPKAHGTGALGEGMPSGTSVIQLSRKIFGDGIPRNFIVSSSLSAWIQDFCPEIIYTFLGSMAQIRIASHLTSSLKVPLAIHIMDDWPAVIYQTGLFGPLIRSTVMSEFRTLIAKASVRLAICEEMCEEYRQRFGYAFQPFHNAIDMSQWHPLARRQWSAGDPFIVRYAGSILGEAQRTSLRDICLAISNLRSRGEKVELWIHAPASQRILLAAEQFDGLHVAEPPDPASIVELLASADLLVLPFNFDKDSAEYLRLSMPTKVPAYMASGTPVLVYGPSSIAPVKYALREGWGYVVCQPEVSLLEKAVRRLMVDDQLREMQGRRAQYLAQQRHDARRVRVAFQSTLAAAVHPGVVYE